MFHLYLFLGWEPLILSSRHHFRFYEKTIPIMAGQKQSAINMIITILISTAFIDYSYRLMLHSRFCHDLSLDGCIRFHFDRYIVIYHTFIEQRRASSGERCK